MEPASVPLWDPIELSTAPDPAEAFAHAFAQLRSHGGWPYCSRWGGFWSALRYRHVARIAADHQTFVSSIQNLVPPSPRSGLPRVPLQLEPPAHTRFRHAVNPLFEPHRLRPMEPELVSLVQRFLRPCLRRGNVDAVADYAAQLPLRALARVLGLDEEGIEQARSVSARYVEAVAAADPDLAARLSAELDAFARTVVHSRLNATRPTQDDPLVQLLARSRSLEIGLDHVAGFVRALLVAADRSTTNALGSAIWHLARDLSLQQWLRDHPDSVPDAVEELFRLYPPTLATARTALCDVMIEGQRIRSGEVVAMVFFAANRDPEVFTDPDRFRLRRTHQHLSFGHGIHKCPGRDLARMLVCTALRELLTATRQFRLAGPVEFRRWPEFGPSRLPLYLRSAP